MKTTRIVFGLLLGAALAAPVLAQQKPRMYKCVDARGKVYYSDKLSADCGESTGMTRQGRVIQKQETARPGQAAKPEDDEAKRKQVAEQDRRDRALMATYTSESEIDAALERSLAIPVQAIKTTENRLKRTNSQLLDLKKQAETLEAQKKAVPASLREDIDQKQREVSALEAELAQKKANADAIRTRYDADKQRFREIRAGGTKN